MRETKSFDAPGGYVTLASEDTVEYFAPRLGLAPQLGDLAPNCDPLSAS